MDSDPNLLFGVAALQMNFISRDQFIDACSAWAAQRGDPLSELLRQRGLLNDTSRAAVEERLGSTSGPTPPNQGSTVDHLAAGSSLSTTDQPTAVASTPLAFHPPAGAQRYTIKGLHA